MKPTPFLVPLLAALPLAAAEPLLPLPEAPVVVVSTDPAALDRALSGGFRKAFSGTLPEDDPVGRGLRQTRVGGKSISGLRRQRAVHAVGIRLSPAHTFDQSVPDVSGPVLRRVQIERPQRMLVSRILEDQQFDAFGVAAEDGEVEAVAAVVHAQRQRASRTGMKAVVPPGGRPALCRCVLSERAFRHNSRPPAPWAHCPSVGQPYS